MAAVKPPSAKSAISQRIFSEATVLKLEQDERNYAILRVSELCNLRWRYVIRRSNGIQLDVVSGKGDKQRYVLLPEGSWNILSAIREVAAADTDFRSISYAVHLPAFVIVQVLTTGMAAYRLL